MPTTKTRFFKDVVHGEIVLYHDWALELTKSYEFVRLTRIKQLGLTFRLYPNATHTRYAHSLGVYDLANRLIKQLNCFNDKEANELAAAALLHDFGHGPHSHAFEEYTQVQHEKYSKSIILDPHSEVNKILKKYKINPQNVCDILDHKHNNNFLNDLISSQIDVDRMDYLARDSHFTGACYGNIDISMMIRWLMIQDNKLCFNSKAISSIENFLLARYHMYQQVYEQPKTVALQQLIKKMLSRFKNLYKNDRKIIVNKYHMAEFFEPWLLDRDFSIDEYIKIDDTKFEMFVDQMQYEKDLFIQEAFKLYTHFTNNDYKIIENTAINIKKYTDIFSKISKFPELYLHECTINNKSIYKANIERIWVYDEITKKIDSLENVSQIIKKLLNVCKSRKVLVVNNNI